MRLAIVGNTILHDSLEAFASVEDAIERHGPKLIVSGGAIGVDKMAEHHAQKRDIPFREHLPKTRDWAGYKARNRKIVEDCDHLVRIFTKRAETYGSGWTADYARKLGKTVEEIEVP